jgi:hypothetical protein
VPPAFLAGFADQVDDLVPAVAADVVEVEHAAHAVYVDALASGFDAVELAG